MKRPMKSSEMKIYLEDLENTDYYTVKIWLREANLSLMKNKIAIENAPWVIKHIISLIVDGKTQLSYIKDKKYSDREILLFMGIKNTVTDVITQFDNLFEYFLPEAKKYLSNIDIQTELIQIFCKDYVFGALKKYEAQLKLAETD